MSFCCRVCGGDEFIYSEKINLYYCANCSIIFVDEHRFTTPVINYIKLDPDAKKPFKALKNDSGYDIFSIERSIVFPHRTNIIKTGIAVELPKLYELQLRPRSGLSKKGMKTDFGTIDNGYRGEIGISVHNATEAKVILEKHSRLGQLVCKPVLHFDFMLVDKLSKTERNVGGFGHTGI